MQADRIDPIPQKGAKATGEVSLIDRVLVVFGFISAFFPTIAVIFIVAILLINAIPSIRYNGLGFLYHTSWNFGNFYGSNPIIHKSGVAAPVGASYGALPFILGTLLTSIIAFIVGVPVAVGAALFLAERTPLQLRRVLSYFMELLAGIPSVVYGLWGLIVFGPFLAKYVYPAIANTLGKVIPWLGPPVGSGLGLLTSGLILAIMIVPIVASTTRDLLAQVPALPKEGALALGLTPWESVLRVSLPWVRSGIIGASILGWARALGETMAVLIVSGNGANALPTNIYGPISTIATAIVSLLDSAQSDPTGLAVSALAEAGLILMLITLLTNILARWMVRRIAGTNLPIGRGV